MHAKPAVAVAVAVAVVQGAVLNPFAIALSLSTPYWQEQFGMVLVEAMASGVAVVTTRSGTIPEVVGDAAMVVAPYDLDELARALETLAIDDAKRHALGAAGRRRAEERYSIDEVAKQLAAAYRTVLR